MWSVMMGDSLGWIQESCHLIDAAATVVHLSERRAAAVEETAAAPAADAAAPAAPAAE